MCPIWFVYGISLLVFLLACFVKMSRGDKIYNHLKNESTQEKGNEFLLSEGFVSDILNDDVSPQTTYSKSSLC